MYLIKRRSCNSISRDDMLLINFVTLDYELQLLDHLISISDCVHRKRIHFKYHRSNRWHCSVKLFRLEGVSSLITLVTGQKIDGTERNRDFFANLFRTWHIPRIRNAYTGRLHPASSRLSGFTSKVSITLCLLTRYITANKSNQQVSYAIEILQFLTICRVVGYEYYDNFFNSFLNTVVFLSLPSYKTYYLTKNR